MTDIVEEMRDAMLDELGRQGISMISKRSEPHKVNVRGILLVNDLARAAYEVMARSDGEDASDDPYETLLWIIGNSDLTGEINTRARRAYFKAKGGAR